MALKVLCTVHDISTHAFFIKEGTLSVKSDVFSIEKLPVKNLLLGTYELLLAKDLNKVPHRKLHIEVESDEPPREVPFTLVEDMFLDFQRGKAVNRFLALLVERSNGAIKKMSAHDSWRRYEDFARFLSEISDKLVEINKNYSLLAIDNVVRKLGALHIVEYGKHARSVPMLPPLDTGMVTNAKQVLLAKPGKTICKEGDAAEGLYVLLEGEVLIKKGERVLASLKNPGESFGELSLFLKSTRTADVYAAKETKYLLITNEQLPEFHRDHPLLFFSMARATAKRIQRNLNELEVMSPIVSVRVDTVLGHYATMFVENFRYLKRTSEIRAIVKLTQELQEGIDKRT